MREWRRISSFFFVQRSNTKKVQGNPCLSERSKEMTPDGDVGKECFACKRDMLMRRPDPL